MPPRRIVKHHDQSRTIRRLHPIRVKQVTCMTCDKKISQFKFCQECRFQTCGDGVCNFDVFECANEDWHRSGSKNACSRCRDKDFSKVVDGKYYCPQCAPNLPEFEEEFQFKSSVQSVYQRIWQEYHKLGKSFPFQFPDEFLNNPDYFSMTIEDIAKYAFSLHGEE